MIYGLVKVLQFFSESLEVSLELKDDDAMGFYFSVVVVAFETYPKTFSCLSSLQKPDSDLIFDDGLGSSLSDENSNHFNENTRTKLVSKRTVSDDSDKQTVDDSQIESDSGWLSRIKRSLSSLLWKNDESVVQKRETKQESKDLNKSQDSFDDLNDYHKLLRRKRQTEDDEDDEDEDTDNESSGDDAIIERSTASSEIITEALAPVKDDKYCKDAVDIEQHI